MSSQTNEQRNAFCEEAAKSLSLPRINRYWKAEDPDRLDSLARHLWNIDLSAALYPVLQMFEVILRNAIHNGLTTAYAEDWFYEPQLLRDIEWRSVEAAEKSLLKIGKAARVEDIKINDLVSELTLGFWAGLFVNEYDKTIAAKAIRHGLYRLPNHLKNRNALYSRFERARHLRNRISHHEPVWHWDDLPQRHQDILEIIGFLSPANAVSIRLIDRFPEVYGCKWQYYRDLIGNGALGWQDQATD